MDTTSPALALSSSQAWAMLRESRLGRLAVVTEAGPDIFPVTFVVDGGSIVFRTAAGTKLDASDGKQVALEADGVDAEEGSAWSVVVKGRGREVRGLHESLDALFLPLTPLHPAAKPHLVRVEVTEISGRWFRTV
ncbi:MAG: pyridoxamine 5'-phosphate oxidase family protein [Nocardioides sp.]|nr:pyridoxamine 5'-phosphate oxidase family protein [Nocardioides sp.]